MLINGRLWFNNTPANANSARAVGTALAIGLLTAAVIAGDHLYLLPNLGL